MGIQKITCEQYNMLFDKADEFSDQAHVLAHKLRHGKIILICDACSHDLEEQKHVDDSKKRLKRQMVCTNPDKDAQGKAVCGKSFYRNETNRA